MTHQKTSLMVFGSGFFLRVLILFMFLLLGYNTLGFGQKFDDRCFETHWTCSDGYCHECFYCKKNRFIRFFLDDDLYLVEYNDCCIYPKHIRPKDKSFVPPQKSPLPLHPEPFPYHKGKGIGIERGWRY